MMSIFSAWYSLIAEPKNTRIAALIVYVVAILLGVVAWFAPPTTLENAIGPFITWAMGLFYLIGGLTAAVVVLRGYIGIERVGVIFIGGAVLVRLITIIATALEATAGARWMQIGEIVLIAALLTVRFLSIRGMDYDPELDARRAKV